MNARTGKQPSTRDRIVEAALELFVEKGYKATTIVDIEQAAGLTPGGGGTYRHFPSKQAILEAGIEQGRRSTQAVLAPVPTSMLEAALGGIEMSRANAQMTLLVLRDLGQFPELQQKVMDDVVMPIYQVAAERTAVISPTGDADAIAAVVSHAMLGFILFESVLGTHALDVDADRFAAGWARLLDLVIADEFGQKKDQA